MVYPIKTLAQLAAREAENPMILGSILDFDRFLGSIPAFDHFLPKKSRQGNALARERVLFQERVLFLGQEGRRSGMLFNRVNQP